MNGGFRKFNNVYFNGQMQNEGYDGRFATLYDPTA